VPSSPKSASDTLKLAIKDAVLPFKCDDKDAVVLASWDRGRHRLEALDTPEETHCGTLDDNCRKVPRQESIVVTLRPRPEEPEGDDGVA